MFILPFSSSGNKNLFSNIYHPQKIRYDEWHNTWDKYRYIMNILTNCIILLAFDTNSFFS